MKEWRLTVNHNAKAHCVFALKRIEGMKEKERDEEKKQETPL